MSSTVALIGSIGNGGAASIDHWIGSVSSDWYTGLNWDLGFRPTPLAGQAVIDTASPNPTVINGGSAGVSHLIVGDSASGSLLLTGGAQFRTDSGLIGNQIGSNGTVTIDGNSKWTVDGGVLQVGKDGVGLLTINSGVLSTNTAIVDRGAVIVDGNNATWDNTGGTIIVGQAWSGALLLANGGTLKTRDLVIGQGTFSILAIGGVQQPAAAGFLRADHLVLGPTNATVLFNHTDPNYVFEPTISGVGRLVFVGPGKTSLTGDASGFTGATVVSNGTLSVDTTLGGTMTIYALGRLEGTGTIGDTIVSGTIAPGHSIGTLNVAGSITFDVGAIYEVEANAAGQSDRITASGSAKINAGSVKVLASVGNYSPSTRYTILTAAGGRTGVFENVSSNLTFLDPSLSYDANNVYLTLTRNNVAFGAIGLTRNQIASGGGVEGLGFGNPVWNAVVQLDAPTARRAFDQLSGEVYASAKTALIEDSHFVRVAATDRIRSAFGAVAASSMPVMAYADGGPVLSKATTDRLSVWGLGFGSWGRINSDGNVARLAHSSGGLLMGLDAPVFDTWRLGLLAGYSRTTFNARDRASSGASDNYHLGLYGGRQWGNLGLRTGLAYTWHDIDTSRAVAFPGFGDSLKSKYRAGTFQAFGDLGYRIDTAVASFEPFANLGYVNLNTDSLTEQGGAAALRANGQTTSTTFTTLGLRASTTFDLGGIRTTARGTFGWRHAFGGATPLSTQSFAGGSAFTIAGVPIARNAVVIEAGLDMAITRAATLGVSYNGQLASSAQQHAFKANFNVKF